MADQARRFVDDQQVGVFVEDGKQVFQVRVHFNNG
jgi:sucrose-6-phosphate hydrolase SacC (GH32 family)